MSTMNQSLSPEEVYRHLQHYDDIYGEKYLPAIIFVSVLMSMGLVGNSLVCFVYLVKFKPSTIRCFIVSLAVLDLLNCFISCPFDIADMRYRYTFGAYTTMCKMMRIFVTFTSVSSALILIPVAADRYRKICRPLGKQMTRLRAKVAIGICCGIGALVSAPATIFYGPRTVTTDIAAVNGSDCSTPDKYVGTRYPLIYNAVNLLVFFTSVISLIVLYSLIWRAVRKQINYRRSTFTANIAGTKPPTAEELNTKSGNRGVNQVTVSSSVDGSSATVSKSNTLTSKGTDSGEGKDTPSLQKSENVNKTKTSNITRKQSRRDMGVNKTTLMLFLITLVFVLCYLPHLGLMATRALHKQIFDDINNVQFGAFYFFFKSYFINSAFNPIIYSFCNAKFRHELICLFKTLRCKCCHR